MDVWELWLLISIGSFVVLWVMVELVAGRSARRDVDYTRRQESARRDWARMIESSCYYKQGDK